MILKTISENHSKWDMKWYCVPMHKTKSMIYTIIRIVVESKQIRIQNINNRI